MRAASMRIRTWLEADSTRRGSRTLPKAARSDVILKTPRDGNLGAALTSAMEALEAAFPPLAGQLPKDYGRFEASVLEEMMRMFDSEGLRTASGNVFGRIYEYFLAEFSKQGAHDNGEFFTPPSIVQTTTDPSISVNQLAHYINSKAAKHFPSGGAKRDFILPSRWGGRRF